MNPKTSKSESAKPAGSLRDANEAALGDHSLIVAIGASAGGIEASIELLRNLDANTGMSFVIIQHLDPKHPSIIRDLLARETSMRVLEVKDGTRVEPDRVYVIPPNAMMSIRERTLLLTPREESRAGHMPIDHFMRALAEELGNQAIGVILSGTGSDGMLGLAEIQARGGVTFSQDEASAKYDGMPRAAIAAGCVDYVLPPQAIAAELRRIANHPYVGPQQRSVAMVQPNEPGLGRIFQLLRRTTRVDFTHYRKTTILRRIQRRMVVHKIDRFADYVKYVEMNPAEIKSLYQDMLIHVTSFFRNPRVFDALTERVFPRIAQAHESESSNIRMWVPGCATGEEVYSLAIAMLEYLASIGSNIPIQLFGTDVSETSVQAARAGLYPFNIQGDVSPERLRLFFSKTDRGYRINKNIRDLCVFAQHNVLNDPPFSRMDVICCRNLLIYFEPVLQSRVISLFNYATRPGGFLVLGASEGVGAAANLFNVEDRENKVFSKKAPVVRQVVAFSLDRHSSEDPGPEVAGRAPRPPRQESGWQHSESQKEFDRRLLAQYSPPTVFISEDMEIVHMRGKINRYFKLVPGRPVLNALKMAREGLLPDLQSAILKARKEKRPVHKKDVLIKIGNGNDDASHRSGDRDFFVSFDVAPFRAGMNEWYFMIVFSDERSARAQLRASRPSARGDSRSRQSLLIRRLEQELATTKEYLQSVAENQEATNEELQSANEEILSSNEELQSTNEELETAKEELQSANEELSTVNDELRGRNLEITQLNKDLRDLFSSVYLAAVSGDSVSVRSIIQLFPAELESSVLQARGPGKIADIEELARQEVKRAGQGGDDGRGGEVVDGSGKAYRVHVLPYSPAGREEQGALVVLMDSEILARLSVRAHPGDEERRPAAQAAEAPPLRGE